MNVFSASPVQSCDLTSGRLRKPRPPRDPEGRRGAMDEGVFSFFLDLGWLMIFFALVVGVWAFLFVGFLGALSECFGIDLLARWRKRE